MFAYIVRRILMMIPILIAISIITFIIMQLVPYDSFGPLIEGRVTVRKASATESVSPYGRVAESATLDEVELPSVLTRPETSPSRNLHPL